MVRIDLQFGPDPDLGPEFEKPWSTALGIAAICLKEGQLGRIVVASL